MTETSGGSDVSRTETVARKEGDHYRLYGTKFYTSATTSQMAIALARIEDASGNTIAGSRGLSTFYLEVHDEAGQLNNMSIRRLKDKMGSKALPTAEITLEGTTAQLVGEPGAGVRQISSLFNMTRIQNGIAAVSSMRRMVAFVRDYAERREAFGRRLIDLPLYAQGVAQMETEVQGGLQLVFYLVSLLGKEESGKIAADEQAILRILMPLAKLYTAKQGIDVAAEGIEAIGAAAYMEDTGLPRLYREAVALAIWEGATNVCCLDAMRAIVREGALEPFLADVARRGEAIQLEDLVEERSAVLAGVGLCRSYIEKALGAGPETGEAAAREIAFGLTNLAIAALLLEHAQWASRNENANSHRCTAAARRWCRKPLYPQIVVDDRQRDETALLARSGEGVASIQSANERVNIEPPRIRSQPTEQREVG
ncbi:MAG: acyl-CoA dehydrogenase family protein, partial [Planctomycetota bacterium]